MMNNMNNELYNNPIIKGQFADPDLAKFGDTYYLYGTTDGHEGWSGKTFSVHTSKDLAQWKDEGIILDLASPQVPWAVGSAWAPCIACKNGKYYFYFCGKDKDGDSSIGVAVSDTPIGPFISTDEPLITKKMCLAVGVSMGQAIDPSIYYEDDGSVYILFGNGDAAIVRLGEDMMSIDVSTLSNIDGAHDLREAITVIKKDGLYHFTWSCDDTGSPNYHVNYGTSKNLYGPIEYVDTVLSKSEEEGILGTGHHCIYKEEVTGDYYIAYHRFVTPLGQYTSGLGFHRETCIDVLEFSEEGYMKKVIPTHKGVRINV